MECSPPPAAAAATRPAPGLGDLIRVLEGDTCKFRYEKFKIIGLFTEMVQTPQPTSAASQDLIPATGRPPARLYGPASSPGPHTCILPSPLYAPPPPPKRGLSPSVGTRRPLRRTRRPVSGTKAASISGGVCVHPFPLRSSFPSPGSPIPGRTAGSPSPITLVYVYSRDNKWLPRTQPKLG